jgi:hypothetical protein
MIPWSYFYYQRESFGVVDEDTCVYLLVYGVTVTVCHDQGRLVVYSCRHVSCAPHGLLSDDWVFGYHYR